MTDRIVALPGAATEPVTPRFDLDAASEAEYAAWLAARQSVLAELAEALPFLRGHGWRPHLSEVS